MRWFPPQSSSGLDKRDERKIVKFLEKVEWQVATTSLHNDVPLDTEVCYK